LFEKIDYIYEVYREKSFSKAAKKMFISQPALSKIIRKAETDIGVPIFDRSTIPITLTPEGEKYIEAIKAIYQIESNVKRYFKDLDELKKGTLSLGGSSYFCSFVFPNMISYFKNMYPGIQCDLTEGNVEEMKRGLLQGKLDLVLETGLQEDKYIKNIYWKTEQIILAVPKNYKINKELEAYQISPQAICDQSFLSLTVPFVPLNMFKDIPFVKMKPGNDMYTRSTQICKDAGFEMKTKIYVDQVMTSLNIASTGLGALFVRSDIVKYLPRADNLFFYKIDHPLATRKINWAVKRGAYLSKAARTFIKLANYSR
jgi:DNA-binding transcriptional LysR family regulator